MKKTITGLLCILTAAALLLCAVPVTASENEQSLSVFVASDIHYRPQSSLVPLTEEIQLPGDRLYAHANTKSMLTYEADAVLDAFLTDFAESDAEYLLIPGDLSEDGQWDEHLAIAQKLRECKEKTGKKIFVIPGNHDIRTSASGGRLDLTDFLDVYADIGYDEALVSHEGSASYTAELSGGYRLLAIDACIYREDGSQIDEGLLAWIDAQIQAAKDDGKRLIGMVHHSLLKHFGIESIGMNMLCLEDYKQLATKFADAGIKYFLTGHEHANDISAAVSQKGNVIYDIETGCLLAYPNAYRSISFSESAVEIETRYVKEIDTSLLPSGYTAEQLELLENDFPAYSYGYFRAGLRSFAYDIPDGTKKAANTLKIDEGTKEYTALEAVMDILSQAMRLPLYDSGTAETDSVQELAASAGITLEQSEFADVIDIAAVLYAAHFAGDESTGFDSPAVKLLGQSLKAALVYAFTNIPSSTANILFDCMGISEQPSYTPAALLLYANKAADKILREYIRPLANGIVNDISVPADLNVTLPSYSSQEKPEGDTIAISVPRNMLNILRELFTAFFRAIFALFKL